MRANAWTGGADAEVSNNLKDTVMRTVGWRGEKDRMRVLGGSRERQWDKGVDVEWFGDKI